MWGERTVGWVLAALLLGACVGCPAPGARRDPAVTESERRIAVMAPAAAEMLAALGAESQVVGIGDFVTGPASIASLPRIGAYNAPNVERVVELRADLYVSAASEAATAAHHTLEGLGVEVLALDTSTFDGVFASLAELGRVLGLDQRAREVADGMRERLDDIRRTARGLPQRRVLFVVGRDPLFVAGPGSHIDEMISAVGGINVIDDAPSPYDRVSMEAAIERMPEVIIDTSDNGPTALRGRLPGDWARWEFLPAVRDDRVYQVDPSRLVIPGIRLPEMTALMGKLIQPEAFGEAGRDELVSGASP